MDKEIEFLEDRVATTLQSDVQEAENHLIEKQNCLNERIYKLTVALKEN